MTDPKGPVLAALGVRVRELREARGMTQGDLSAATGINRVTLSRIERGQQDVGVVRVTRIAVALDTPVSSLFAASESVVDPSEERR